eukprot:jgi/Tetstr1/434165/TSEL_002489.t1
MVGEEALLVSAVTKAMCGRLNNHHMRGGLKPATATFRGVPADLLVSLCEARPDMRHKVRNHMRHAKTRAEAHAELHVKRGAHGEVKMIDMGDIVSTRKEDTDLQLPTRYSVNPSDPKAWPSFLNFDDFKALAMRELHALCEAAPVLHLGGPLFWIVRSERARELRERARKLRAKERQERMERESAGTSDSTNEGDYSAPSSPHRHSPESYDSIDS